MNVQFMLMFSVAFPTQDGNTPSVMEDLPHMIMAVYKHGGFAWQLSDLDGIPETPDIGKIWEHPG